MITMIVDGSGKGDAAVLAYRDGIMISRTLIDCAGATNNEAEYTAILSAMRLALSDFAQEPVQICTDSQLVHRQLTGAYKVKAKNLMPKYQEAQSLMQLHPSMRIDWVPRERVRAADQMIRDHQQKPSSRGE